MKKKYLKKTKYTIIILLALLLGGCSYIPLEEELLEPYNCHIPESINTFDPKTGTGTTTFFITQECDYRFKEKYKKAIEELNPY